MLNFLSLLLGSVALRPYVFIFLGAYLLLATLHLGAGRTVTFLALGYLICWAAELCAINFGFPFGEYLYIPATLGPGTLGRRGPLHGLPVLRVPGLCQLLPGLDGPGGRALARLQLSPPEDAALQKSWRTLGLGAVLMVALDIVIDPLALRGYRWFLGQIYGYPEGGVYFGVTLSNFGGWFLVALVLIRLLQYLATGPLPACRFWDWGRRRLPAPALPGVGLYLGVLGFNLTMTFLIGETTLGWVGVFIYLPFLTWWVLKVWPGKAG